MSSASEHLDVLILDERGIVNAVAQKELALGGLACFPTVRRSESLALIDSHRPYLIVYIPQTGADAIPACGQLAARAKSRAVRSLIVCDGPVRDTREIAESGVNYVVSIPRNWRDLVPQLKQICNESHRLRSLEERAEFQRRSLMAANLGALAISKRSHCIRWLSVEGTGLLRDAQSQDSLATGNQHWRILLVTLAERDRARVSEFISDCLAKPRTASLTARTTGHETVNLACVPETGDTEELLFVVRNSAMTAAPRTVSGVRVDASVVDRPATYIRETLRAAMQQNYSGAVLLVQLQDVDTIYRQFGYRLGSRFLTEFGECLGRCLRAEDYVHPLQTTDGRSPVVAQVSDNDFVVVLDCPVENTPLPILRRIRARLGASLEIDGNQIDIRYAFGFARWPVDGSTPDSLLHAANSAVHDSGREIVGAGSRRDLPDIEVALYEALREQAIRMRLQPKVSAGSGRIIGFEALARWEHEGQPVPPDVFVPVAEQAGLIGAIGDSIANQAIAAHQEWLATGLGCVPIAINVSPYQFDNGDFADRFLELCECKALRPGCLSIEITESSLLRNEESTLEQLERLRAAGVSIALDDFGTGYSSLSYLRKLPLDVLKIDKSFIDDLTENAIDPGLVVSIIAIGTNLGLRVVAEGIETQAQQEMLREWGCHELQGYWFAPPLELTQATALLRGNRILPTQTVTTLPSVQNRRSRAR